MLSVSQLLECSPFLVLTLHLSDSSACFVASRAGLDSVKIGMHWRWLGPPGHLILQIQDLMWDPESPSLSDQAHTSWIPNVEWAGNVTACVWKNFIDSCSESLKGVARTLEQWVTDNFSTWSNWLCLNIWGQRWDVLWQGGLSAGETEVCFARRDGGSYWKLKIHTDTENLKMI